MKKIFYLLSLISLLFNINCSFLSSSTLEVEAAVIYTMGGAQPLARQDFYILDKSASEILRENKNAIWGELLNKDSNNSKDDLLASVDKIIAQGVQETLNRNTDADYISALKLVTGGGTDKVKGSYAKAMNAIKSHIVKSFTTDLQGKVKIENVPIGNYYIFGVAETRKGSAVWNVPIEIKSGKNNLILDNKNMAG